MLFAKKLKLCCIGMIGMNRLKAHLMSRKFMDAFQVFKRIVIEVNTKKLEHEHQKT